MKTINRQQHGFTLIELAIVLVIIGVLVGSFLGTLGARIDNTRRAETREDLEIIKKALLGYVYSKGGYLPCPCKNDCDVKANNPPTQPGQEDRTGGTCDAGVTDGYLGYLPWGTLGLKPGDAWNTLYRYWVHKDFSGSSKIGFGDTGTGRVITRIPDGTGTSLIAGNVVAVIYTHGKNTYGGFGVNETARPGIPAANIDEENNANTNSEFVARNPTEAAATTAGGEFDDILIWISDYELKARMVDARMLPLPLPPPP